MPVATYWDRVRNRAAELGTDGCSFGTSAYRDCCLEHDIAYRTGATVDSEPQTKAQADTRFRACMQAHSRLGWWSPMAWTRYIVVRWFGRPHAQPKDSQDPAEDATT